MKTYAITLLLTTDAPEREAEAFAAELAEDARVHLRDGEELESSSSPASSPHHRSARLRARSGRYRPQAWSGQGGEDGR